MQNGDYVPLYWIKLTGTINEEIEWISMIGIFNGFECMADTDILNKMKKRNTTNHMKVWTL